MQDVQDNQISARKLTMKLPKKLLSIILRPFQTRTLKLLKVSVNPRLCSFRSGEIWNNDTLIDRIKKSPQVQRNYEFKNFTIETDCNGSFINYLNHGIFKINDTTLININ